MKKSMFILCGVLAACSLTAFGFMNWKESGQQAKAETQAVTFNPNYVGSLINPPTVDFVYNVDTRFVHNISKEKLNQAKSIADILPENAMRLVDSFKYVEVGLPHTDPEIRVSGTDAFLNESQLELLQKTDYSTDFYIKADFKTPNTYSGSIDNRYLSYYISIVPEQEAEYAAGHDALIAYLKVMSQEEAMLVTKDQLKPGQVRFSITPKGTVADVSLSSTSGYPSLDETMIDLIQHLPEKWIPARNAQGKKVTQQLVFFYGMQGC